MTTAKFGFYEDYDETEKLARIYISIDDLPVPMPVNISLEDGSDMDLIKDEICEATIWSDEYWGLSVVTPEERLQSGYKTTTPHSLIPSGTFPAKPEDWETFKQNATICFTGVVTEADKTVDPGEEDPKYKLYIEAYGLTFWLYYYGDDDVEPGYIAEGTCWIYGKLRRTKRKKQHKKMKRSESSN